MSVTPGPQPALGISWAVVVPACAAAALLLMFLWVLWAAIRQAELEKLDDPAPALTLDFGKSWSTSLTAVSGVLATVLAGVTYSDVPRQIDKTGLVALSLLFAGLVVVAPFVFQGLRRNPPDHDAQRTLTGTNFGLALACCITFAAVVGELLALALLGWELIEGGPGTVILFIGLLALGEHGGGLRSRGCVRVSSEAGKRRRSRLEEGSSRPADHIARGCARRPPGGVPPPVVAISPSEPPRATLLSPASLRPWR